MGREAKVINIKKSYNKYKDILVDTKNNLWRIAYYLGNKKCCFYTGEPITFDTMELDHIIPQYLFNGGLTADGRNIDDIINDLGFSEDFNKNNIFNIVPCRRAVNNKKSNHYLETSVHHYFTAWSNTVENIINEYNKIVDLRLDEGRVLRLVSLLQSTELPDYAIIDIVKKLEEVDDDRQFSQCRKINANNYMNSSERICLEALFPTIDNLKLFLRISFKSYNLRDVVFNLDGDVIKKYLFKKNNFPIDDKYQNKRNFLIFSNSENNRVTLGKSEFYLTNQEYEDFTIQIDQFFADYCTYINKFEEKYLSGDYKYFSNGGYYFLDIDSSFWDFIQKNYDETLVKTLTREVFIYTGYRRYGIQFMDRSTNKTIMWIYAKKNLFDYSLYVCSEHYLGSYDFGDDWLIDDFIFWFINEFLLQLFKKYSSSLFSFQTKKKLKTVVTKIHNIITCKIENLAEDFYIAKFIVQSSDGLRLDGYCVSIFYMALDICKYYWKIDEESYFLGNLHMDFKNDSINEIINAGLDDKRDLIFSWFEFVLRCIEVTLNNEYKVSDIDKEKIHKILYPFLLQCRNIQLIDKYLNIKSVYEE